MDNIKDYVSIDQIQDHIVVISSNIADLRGEFIVSEISDVYRFTKLYNCSMDRKYLSVYHKSHGEYNPLFNINLNTLLQDVRNSKLSELL